MNKPRLSFWQIWNMSFGFLGIQFGFALQNANVSRIFETLGAKIDAIPILMDCRAYHRLDSPADNRAHERQNMEQARQAPPVFFDRGDFSFYRFVYYAELANPLDCGRDAVDHGYVNKHLDGAVQSIRRRHASVRTKDVRICDAKFLHRYRRGRRFGASVYHD